MDTAGLPLISGDSHVEEPRFLWFDRLPEALRDRAPKTIRQGEDGNWELVGHGESIARGDNDRLRAEEAQRMAAAQPEARLEAMREDGIAGECIYPTIGLYVWNVEDPEVERACCQIYNDWIYETLESKSPRFRCAAIIPTGDVDGAVAEVERIAAMGLAAAMLPVKGTPEYNDPAWEPLWSAIEAQRLPVVMHQGTGVEVGTLDGVPHKFYRGNGGTVANLVALQTMAPRTVALLAGSGVLEDHPDLHFVFVELNAGWISSLMDTVDHYYHSFLEYPGWIKRELRDAPSHYITRQIHGTFQWDPSAIATIGRTGPAPLLWGSDFPHAEGTYPHSRKVVQSLLGDLDEAQARLVAGGTAADLFRFDPEVCTTPV
jgi:predicted TIM-barrel fold metal-dependent hydrolase